MISTEQVRVTIVGSESEVVSLCCERFGRDIVGVEVADHRHQYPHIQVATA